MDAPTALFDSYEADFRQILDGVREKLDGAQDQGAEGKKAALRRVEMELDEADEMLSQMEIEIQGIPTSLRPSYATRARTAKADLARAKKSAKDAHAAGARGELLGGKGGGQYATTDEPYGSSERGRLLAGTALLEDGSSRLRESERIALETEAQGADILRTLGLQRSQIENARDTLHTADSSIDRASGTLKKMIRQAYKQKLVTGAIVLVLILVIAIILYEKLS
ncbi:unnamed protein product [Peniophora sp. CBMAI 1063]|nr:unnamed protein product [Peniophora sp. CBMAI 1063]